MTAERDEFKVPAMWTAVHSPTKSRITTVDHFIYIDQLCGTGMERVFDFFIMITKNFLKDIHMIIMNEYYRKSKPHPLMNEGAGGVDVPKALFYSSSLHRAKFVTTGLEIRAQCDTCPQRGYNLANLAKKNKNLRRELR